MVRVKKDSQRKLTTRSDIAREFADEFMISKTDAELVIEYIFDRIAQHVLADEDVWIIHFGKFYLQQYKNRKVVHPVTGEEMMTSTTRTMKLKPASNLRRFKVGQSASQDSTDDQESFEVDIDV